MVFSHKPIHHLCHFFSRQSKHSSAVQISENVTQMVHLVGDYLNMWINTYSVFFGHWPSQAHRNKIWAYEALPTEKILDRRIMLIKMFGPFKEFGDSKKNLVVIPYHS